MTEDGALVNLPMWELVKATTYGRYLACVAHYEAVVKDYAKGRAIRGVRKSKHEPDFIAAVLALYIDLAPKIAYPRRKRYLELKKMDEFFGPDGEQLEYGEALYYFGLLRGLMEELGLTKTESKSQGEGSRFVGGVTT